MSPTPTGRLFGDDLVLTRTLRAPIADVWASITEPDRTARWFGPWQGDAGPGSTITVSSGRAGLKMSTIANIAPKTRSGMPQPGSATLTTNSVPRTPRMLEGVRSRIAPGDCLTIFPEITASEPRWSEASNRPACVVLSKR